MSIATLITKYFEKKKINTIADLTPDEKVEYDRWQAIMDGNEITVEKIKLFCEAQIKLIEERFANPDNSDKQDSFIKASLHIYTTLIKVIKAPEVERQNLEKYLTTLINQ